MSPGRIVSCPLLGIEIRQPRPGGPGAGVGPRPPFTGIVEPRRGAMRGNAGRSYLLLVARAVSPGRPAILFLPVGVLVQPVGDLIRSLRARLKEGPQTSYRT